MRAFLTRGSVLLNLTSCHASAILVSIIDWRSTPRLFVWSRDWLPTWWRSRHVAACSGVRHRCHVGPSFSVRELDSTVNFIITASPTLAMLVLFQLATLGSFSLGHHLVMGFQHETKLWLFPIHAQEVRVRLRRCFAPSHRWQKLVGRPTPPLS